MRTTTVTEAKNNLSALVSEVDSVGERVVITVNGMPTAVLLGSDDYEALLETVECLSDPDIADAVRSHRAGAAEMLPWRQVDVRS